MKNLLKLTLVLSVFIFSSCEKEKTLESLENQSLTFDEFFEKVSNMDIQTSMENSIYIKYKWNKKNNTISIIGSEEKEMSWAMAFLSVEMKSESNLGSNRNRSAPKVTVACDRGGDGSDDWTNTCNGAVSCGKMIKKCLDQGGCANVCSALMEYYEPEKLFVIEPVDSNNINSSN